MRVWVASRKEPFPFCLIDVFFSSSLISPSSSIVRRRERVSPDR
jgi:hypothetical protein